MEGHLESKYYLNSHKDTPLPTLTDSQRIKLNNILHTGDITNNNISTFSDYEFADSSFVEDVLDNIPKNNNSLDSCYRASESVHCCNII